jgi:hypothetical protein
VGHRDWKNMGDINWGKFFTFRGHKDGFFNYVLAWTLKIADRYIKAFYCA